MTRLRWNAVIPSRMGQVWHITCDCAPANVFHASDTLKQERFHQNIARVHHGDRVITLKGDSLQSLAGLLSRGLISSFDAVYLDASHAVRR